MRVKPEVALVDCHTRVGGLNALFYERLLDENAASHIALGNAIGIAVSDDQDRGRMNKSGVHLDCVIGSDAVSVFGIRHGGSEIPLLRAGAWEI